MAAALASKANWAMQSMQDRLGKIREKTEVIYTLDTLEYLARGGRIGRVKAMAGALLNLKPVIRVAEDGKYFDSHIRTHPGQIHQCHYGTPL